MTLSPACKMSSRREGRPMPEIIRSYVLKCQLQNWTNAELLRLEALRLVSDYLNQHPFSPASVEFTVENLSPRAEIEFALRNCDDDFAAHDLELEVGVGVVLTGAVVPIGGVRCVVR